MDYSNLTAAQSIKLDDWVRLLPSEGAQFMGHRVELEERNGTERTYRVVRPDGTIRIRYTVFPSTFGQGVIWLNPN